MSSTTSLTGNIPQISPGQYFHASVLDSIPSMIAYIDSNCNYAYINPAYAKFLGVSAQEIIGKNISHILGEGIHGQIESEIAEALKGNPVSFEKEINRDGRMFVEVKYFPDFD
jgi:PAS domain S-box-containing protein